MVFSGWLLTHSHMHLFPSYSFMLNSHFFLELNTIPLSGCTTVYLFICWKSCRLFPSFGSYKAAVNIYMQVFLHAYIFNFFLVNTKEHDWWIGKSKFSFIRNCQNILWSGCTFSIPISNGWEFLLLHVLISILCCQLLGFGNSFCCWETLKAGGEGADRGRDGWMALPTQWTWVWANSRR